MSGGLQRVRGGSIAFDRKVCARFPLRVDDGKCEWLQLRRLHFERARGTDDDRRPDINEGHSGIRYFDPNDENVENAAGVAQYTGALAMSGNYKVRVLLPRSEARRAGSGTSYTVKFTIR